MLAPPTAVRVDTESEGAPASEDGPTSGQLRRISGDIGGGLAAHRDVELRAGDVLADRYVIEGSIGSGGHGAIHRAIHRELDMPVAVKVLHLGGDTPEHAEIVQRFVREARIAARIRHRNVLSVYDTGQLADGSPFLVMELIEGEDLEKRIARGALSIAAIVDLGRQLFSGLTAIADAGVLHRDVKPANLMLHRETDGQVLLKLLDFGIARTRAEVARLTVTGVIVGTPHYMSPEQLRGEDTDMRADMYAASAVLYEAATGRPPFDGVATALVIGQILAAPLAPVRSLRSECPAALADLIERGLSRARADRPSHPLQVVAALDEIVRSESLASGALAWVGDVALSRTQPIELSRRRSQTPTQPAVSAPLTLPTSPQKTTRRVAMVGAALLGLALATGLALTRTEPVEATPSVLTMPTAVVATSLAPTPNVNDLLDQGLEALARGELDVALAHYRAAALVDPTRTEAQRGRGLAAARAGLHDEAIAAFERYLAMAPDAPDAERVHSRLETERARRSEGLARRGAQIP